MSERKTVLFVEDYQETRELYESIVQRYGYHVLTAIDPNDALSVIGQNKVDVVVTDIIFDAWSVHISVLLDECKKREIGFILVTGAVYSLKTMDKLYPETLTISKPPEIEELLFEIYKLLRKQDETVPIKKTVLLVYDDYDSTVSMVNFSLGYSGYNVATVGKNIARKALEGKEKIDLVVAIGDPKEHAETMRYFSKQMVPFIFVGQEIPKLEFSKRYRTFLVPAKDAEMEGPLFKDALEKANEASDKAKLEKKTLLCIENDNDLLETMKRYFGLEPYRVLTANSISDAKKSVELYGIDVIITDLKLPGSTQEEMVNFLKRMQSIGVEIIFLTGAIQETKYTAEMEKIKARFFEKPVYPARLTKGIEEAMLRSPDWGEKEILLCDDDGDLIDSLKIDLEEYGFKIRCCGTIEEAETVLTNGRIMATIMDMRYEDVIPVKELVKFIKECMAKGIVTALLTGGDYSDIPTIEGLCLLAKPSQADTISSVLKKRILEQQGKHQQISDEQLAILCNPEWHMSTPTVKWIDMVLSDPNASRAEREIALLTADMPRIKQEIEESARHGEWPQKELNELMDKYHETLERLSWLKHKTYGTPLPEELKLKKTPTKG